MSAFPRIKALCVLDDSLEYSSEDLKHCCNVDSFFDSVQTTLPKIPIYSNRIPPQLPQNIQKIITEDESKLNTAKQSVEIAKKIFTDLAKSQTLEEADSIAFFYGWYPFLDLDLLKELYGSHSQYLAHLSYGENIPLGFVPDLLSWEFIQIFPENLQSDLSLRQFVFNNIDSYDLEILYRTPDLRQYRLDFSGTTSRSLYMIKQIKEKEASFCYKDLEDMLYQSPEFFRPFPSYIEIELSNSSLVSPTFLPKSTKDSKQHLNFTIIEKLYKEIKSAPIQKDISIALGGLGDPLEHPQFLEILELLLSLENVKNIYLETFAVVLTGDLFKILANIPQSPEKLVTIIRLSTLQKERYQALYQSSVSTFENLMQNVQDIEESIDAFQKKLSSQNNHYSVYIEMLRLKENEDEIEDYFSFMGKYKYIKPLLQKFNNYIDLLENKKAVDLSPLHRSFCWHLARDFYITADGFVPICKQDPFAIQKEHVHDFSKQSIEEIWSANMQYYTASMQGKHELIPMPCLKCDEWYCFNA